ncbi:MAG TPA: glycosyltransferase family 2 protein [Candidatus Dormibacteraeota bacterium]|nr:glycosyltransferase family 2 protein [Candidatus Dormibacteraeota bacterium]
MATVVALIPAYDCAATIGEVVAGARRHVERVLVVDDGSHDDTAARASASGAAVLRQTVNGGKGAALRAGFARLAGEGVTHVLTMDGDGQHLASEIPLLLAASAAAPAALIVGARRIGDQEVTPIKLFGNRFANRWVEIACGRALPDTQSGFRVYPLAETLRLGATAGRFAFETEVLIRAARAGMEIISVPVAVYYPPAAERVSHYRPWGDTLRIIAVVVGLILRRR